MYHADRTDKKAELETVQRVARECGAHDAIICNHWARVGAGAIDLANAVDRACNQPAEFKFLYDLNVSLAMCQEATYVVVSRPKGIPGAFYEQ